MAPPPSQSQSQSQLPFDAGNAAAEAAELTLSGRALAADPGVWDELRDSHGLLRAPWLRFARSLPPPPSGLDVSRDLDRRVGQVAHRIRLDGVTHNVFSDNPDPNAASRPWSLELLPLLIEAADWAGIEAGVSLAAPTEAVSPR